MKFLTPGSSATTLTWSGAWDRRLPSLRWGPIFLKGTLRWYWWCLSVSLAVSVGVGNRFPPFQFPQQGVVDAFLAEGRCVDENGLAGVLPGAEMCPCVVSLLSESLGLVGRQLPVELLGGADCQACVSYGVALHLIGGWLGPVGQSGKDILLDFQPGRFGGAVGGQEFDCPVVGEPAGVGPEFKLGPLVPVWVDSDLPGFSCGTF